MAHRYFTSEIQGDQAFLRGQEANHLARVLRAQLGQQVLLCDGRGTDYQAEILAADPAEISLRILESHPSDSEPGVAVTLYVGYPKQDKLEWIIQKGVELGAARIVPFFCRSCVAKPKKEEDKNQRYQRIALEAAKQSGRGLVPTVELPLSYYQLVQRRAGHDAALFCYERGGRPLKDCIAGAKDIAIITGPEGGFFPEEAEAAQNAGANWIGLGPRILRCETAPLAALAAVMTLAGQLE